MYDSVGVQGSNQDEEDPESQEEGRGDVFHRFVSSELGISEEGQLPHEDDEREGSQGADCVAGERFRVQLLLITSQSRFFIIFIISCEWQLK